MRFRACFLLIFTLLTVILPARASGWYPIDTGRFWSYSSPDGGSFSATVDATELLPARSSSRSIGIQVVAKCSHEMRPAVSSTTGRPEPPTGVTWFSILPGFAWIPDSRRVTSGRGVKAPREQYRNDVFDKAGVRVSPAESILELGGVFVDPVHRGNRTATRLCQLLPARAPTTCVFATTRPDNISMVRILLALGFARVGKPYPRRNEELVLFLKPCPIIPEPRPAA